MAAEHAIFSLLRPGDHAVVPEDMYGGELVLNDEKDYESIHLNQKSVGAVPSPFDSWLTLRGLKTLAVRMKEHEKNASDVLGKLEICSGTMK